MSYFVLDPKSASPSFFQRGSQTGVEAFTMKDLDFLYKKAVNSEEKISRILLHSDLSKSMHVMIICELKGKQIPIKKHLSKCKYYSLLSGELQVEIFGEDKKLREEFTLSSLNPILYLPNGVYHRNYTKSDVAFFVEVVNGPFSQDESDRVFLV